jgi:hypothetical protein
MPFRIFWIEKFFVARKTIMIPERIINHSIITAHPRYGRPGVFTINLTLLFQYERTKGNISAIVKKIHILVLSDLIVGSFFVTVDHPGPLPITSNGSP